MSDKTNIEWTRGDDGTPGATWNPVTGCTEVSPGCDHCYAKTFAERWRGTPGHYFEQGFDVQLRPNKLDLPLRWKRPRRIFVNSMSDLFHDQVPDDYIARVWAVMALAPQHTFQVLTKRHGRMRSLLNSDTFLQDLIQYVVAAEVHDGLTYDGDEYTLRELPNVWLGVSVENQQWADIRIPALLDTPAAVRFLSCEPLLGPVDLDHWLAHTPECLASEEPPWCICQTDHRPGDPYFYKDKVDWVIVGGESGPGARPMHPDWARSLRDQCTTAGVPFLFKQWGDGSLWIDRHGDVWTPGSDGLMHTPETAPFPREHVERKWGPLKPLSKKAAGRELDGRTWDEFPEVSA